MSKMILINNTQWIRGTAASFVSTTIANMINAIILKKTQIKEDYMKFINLFVIGNILSYSFDIIFAKQIFNKEVIRYTDFRYRFTYLMNSYMSKKFVKFVLTVIIDVILIETIYNEVIKYLDKYKINFIYRDSIIAGTISLGTFLLFINSIRFNWAYADDDNLLIDIMMYIWFGLSILIYFKSDE